MKVSFVIYDDAGRPADEGTIETFWDAPHQSKAVFKSGVDSEALYSTSAGPLRAGAEGPESDLLEKVSKEYLIPVDLSEETINGTRFHFQWRMIGDSAVRCLTPTDAPQHVPIDMAYPLGSPTYCVGGLLPVVLSAVHADDLRDFVHSKSVIFQHRYVPQDLEVLNGQSTMLRAHLDLLEGMQPPNEDDLKPPQDAVLARAVVFFETKHLDYKQLKLKNPAPGLDTAARGEVVLQAHIGTDGRVLSSFAVSGTPMLQKAAMDSVRNWKSKPYIDPEDGKPAEVTRRIAVSFP